MNDESPSHDDSIVRGPLLGRVENAAFLPFLRLPATRAVPLERHETELTWASHYSSIFHEDTSASSTFRLDGEVWRNVAHLRHGVTDRAQVYVSVPTIYASSGFLDSFVEDFHDTFDFPQGGRDRNPDDQFAMGIESGSSTLYQLKEDQLAIGDISLGLDVQVLEESESLPALTVRAAVEFPTGDEDDGFGNGEYDYAVGLGLEKRVLGFVLHGLADYVVTGSLDSFRGTVARVEDTWTLMLAVERPFGSFFSALVQVRYETSPIGGTGIEDLRNAIVGTFGGVFDLGRRTRLQLGFAEDFTRHTAQDFSAHVVLSHRF